MFLLPSVDTFWPFLISIFITKQDWFNFPLVLNSLIWLNNASMKDIFYSWANIWLIDRSFQRVPWEYILTGGFSGKKATGSKNHFLNVIQYSSNFVWLSRAKFQK